MEYIHYGATAFEPGKFKPIQNWGWIKPKGGLWASPTDTENGWRDWCHMEQFRVCNDDNSFSFTLSEEARVLHLRRVADVDELPLDPSVNMAMLRAFDFEALRAQGCDAIEIHISECPALYSAMYGWDMDSILIMNPDVIVTKEA